MATVIRKATVPTKPVQRAVQTAKKAVAVDGFQVVNIDTIEFLSSGRGGGKPMDPAVAKLVEKALSLQVGQGIKVPVNMRIEREINGANGKSVLHTYKGAPSLSKRAKANDMRFRTRRDVSNNLWLFRVEPIQYEEVQVQE